MDYDLERFVTAQDRVYEQVVREITDGRKTGHWMWFMFPQIKGLGKSITSEEYGLEGVEEARAFFNHPILGKRLVQLLELLSEHSNKSISIILGFPDNLKLKSSLTIFEVATAEMIFSEVLEIFYNGERCQLTLAKIE
jgi:uncharacterized protein (DUF1810 family)